MTDELDNLGFQGRVRSARRVSDPLKTLPKDKMWNPYRVSSTSDGEAGALVGKYQQRGDATKVVAQIAYQPEPKW